MKYYHALIGFILLCIPVFVAAEYPTPSHPFISALHDLDMTLSIPDGYSETQVRSNKDVRYDFALINPDTGVEIRYALRPHNGNLILSERDIALPFFETALMNITRGGNNGEYSMFYLTDSALRVIGGEWAVYSEITLFSKKASEFSAGYSEVQVICTHRSDYGQIYTFYLANNLMEIQNLVVNDPTHLFEGALRFNLKREQKQDGAINN